MNSPAIKIIVLRGAGGAAPDLAMFQTGVDSTRTFVRIDYPGWRHYVNVGYSARAIVDDLVSRITQQVPTGPIYIVGLSIGGHFGYATALRLQELGREVGGFCAVDTFMMSTAAVSDGWSRRALMLASRLILGLRFAEFREFIRTRFWRAWLRMLGGTLPGLLRNYAASGRQPWFFKLDPSLEQELSMRLLIEHAAPFVASLDTNPVPLNAPAILLRTETTGKDDAAWKQRCPRLVIRKLPGDHQTVFEPQSHTLIREAFVSESVYWR